MLLFIVIAEILCWYEPADVKSMMLLRPENDSSEKEGYGGRKPEPQMERDSGVDLSVSDVEERINEYPPRKILRQDKFIPVADEVEMKRRKMDELKRALNKELGTDSLVHGLHDRDMWRKLHGYLSLHFKDFMIDGHLSIELHIRYVLCCYIVAFIPAQFAFFFPAFYSMLIPKRAYKVPVLGDALRGLERFLKFVSDNSTKTFIITFYFGRQNSLVEDIEFIKRVPDLIFSDPLAILREVLKFEIRSEGYDNKREL